MADLYSVSENSPTCHELTSVTGRRLPTINDNFSVRIYEKNASACANARSTDPSG